MADIRGDTLVPPPPTFAAVTPCGPSTRHRDFRAFQRETRHANARDRPADTVHRRGSPEGETGRAGAPPEGKSGLGNLRPEGDSDTRPSRTEGKTLVLQRESCTL